MKCSYFVIAAAYAVLELVDLIDQGSLHILARHMVAINSTRGCTLARSNPLAIIEGRKVDLSLRQKG